MTDYATFPPFADDEKRPGVRSWPAGSRLMVGIAAVAAFACFIELVWPLRSAWLERIFTDADGTAIMGFGLLVCLTAVSLTVAFVILLIDVYTEFRT
jgi:hypothetical protein